MSTYQNQFIHALLAYAAQRGISPMQLCNASTIEFTDLQKEGFTPTPDQINRLWRNAAHFTQDNHFGLHFGESMQLAALGLIGQIIATSTTVGEALYQAGRMVHLITDLFRIQTEGDETTFRIQFIPDQEKSASFPYTFRHMADYLLVFVLHELDGLLLKKLKPEAVHLSYCLENSREYERIFRCPVYDTQDQLSLTLPLHHISLPIITANYALQKTLLQHISPLLKPSPMNPRFRHKIYHYLMTNAYLHTPSLEAVAANFHISSRSLQRRLKEEGITFLEIVEDVRKNLAIHYLKSENYQVKDIAYTLGYNDPSAFLRAFKRWTGKTPSSYKNQMILNN